MPKPPEERQRRYSPIGLEVWRRREALGLTREELADLAGLQANHINMIEGGERREIRHSTMAKLAKALGCTEEDLRHPAEISEPLQRFLRSEAGADVTQAEAASLARAVRLGGYPETPATYTVLLLLERSKKPSNK